jgi:hypothetical protein
METVISPTDTSEHGLVDTLETECFENLNEKIASFKQDISK